MAKWSTNRTSPSHGGCSASDPSEGLVAAGSSWYINCSLGIREPTQVNIKSAIAALGAAISLAACSREPPLYFGPLFGPQLASLSGEVNPEAIDSMAYDLRPPPPGRPGY